jgi:tripartite-type tricarboxylate transporter receptor subunit TctC
MLHIRRDAAGLAARAAAVLLPLTLGVLPAAKAQTYPERVVEMINPYPPGGATDIMGRALMDGMAAHLNGRFIFINRPGANGAIGTAAVARAPADGHTVLFTAAVSIIVNPLTQVQAGYTLQSFEHICQAFKNEMAIVVRADSPIRTVGDLIKAGQEKPGQVSYGILGIGSIPHLAMVELSQVAKASFNAVPFKGDADVMQQVLGGHTDFGAVVLASAARSNTRIIGLFSQQRNPSIPDVPTLREQGFDVAPFSIGGLSTPAGLPAAVKQKLEEACRASAQSEAYRGVMKTLHQPLDYYEGSHAYAKALAQDFEDKRRLLGQLGMVRQ